MIMSSVMNTNHKFIFESRSYPAKTGSVTDSDDALESVIIVREIILPGGNEEISNGWNSGSPSTSPLLTILDFSRRVGKILVHTEKYENFPNDSHSASEFCLPTF